MRGLLLAFLMFQGIEIHAANEADLVIKNAQIFTASQTIGEAEAVAVKDGRFLAVGTNDEIDTEARLTDLTSLIKGIQLRLRRARLYFAALKRDYARLFS